VDGREDGLIHVGLRVDHRDGGLIHFAQDFDDIGHRLATRFHKGCFLGIGAVESRVVDIKIVSFPRDAVLPHPFGSYDGLSRFAEAAARLDGENKSVFNL
jgi:hypothetical protein